MTSRAPDLETILERLEKIEDENRFLKRMGLLILLVSGASLTVGPTVGSFGRGQRSQRLEEFVLKDGSGNVRAKLMVSGDAPRLTLYDADGNPGSPLRAEKVRLANSNEFEPDIESAEVLIGDGAPGFQRDERPMADAPSSALETLGWQHPGLIRYPDWNFEGADSEPQFGQFPASVPDQAAKAIGSRATSWQPTPPVRPAGQGSALLSEVGGLLLSSAGPSDPPGSRRAAAKPRLRANSLTSPRKRLKASPPWVKFRPSPAGSGSGSTSRRSSGREPKFLHSISLAVRARRQTPGAMKPASPNREPSIRPRCPCRRGASQAARTPTKRLPTRILRLASLPSFRVSHFLTDIQSLHL